MLTLTCYLFYRLQKHAKIWNWAEVCRNKMKSETLSSAYFANPEWLAFKNNQDCHLNWPRMRLNPFRKWVKIRSKPSLKMTCRIKMNLLYLPKRSLLEVSTNELTFQNKRKPRRNPQMTITGTPVVPQRASLWEVCRQLPTKINLNLQTPNQLPKEQQSRLRWHNRKRD